MRASRSSRLSKRDITVIPNRRIRIGCLHSIPLRMVKGVEGYPHETQRASSRAEQDSLPATDLYCSVLVLALYPGPNCYARHWAVERTLPHGTGGKVSSGCAQDWTAAHKHVKSAAEVSAYTTVNALPDSLVPIPEMRHPVNDLRPFFPAVVRGAEDRPSPTGHGRAVQYRQRSRTISMSCAPICVLARS